MRGWWNGMGRWRKAATVVLGSIIALVIIGALIPQDDEPDTPFTPEEARELVEEATREREGETTAQVNPRCTPVPEVVLRALSGSLKGQRTIGSAQAVRTEETYRFPRDIAEGAWFVTADVRPNPGLSTWIVGAEAFSTGGGIIIGVDPAARAVSQAGELVSLEAVGISEDDDGFQESIGCLANQVPPPSSGEPEPEPTVTPDPDGSFTSRCSYVLGDFSEGPSGYRFLADADLENTGNVGIVVRTTAIWEQLGAEPVKLTKQTRLRIGQTRTVRFTHQASSDQLDLHQSADGDCEVRSRIVDTFGQAP